MRAARPRCTCSGMAGGSSAPSCSCASASRAEAPAAARGAPPHVLPAEISLFPLENRRVLVTGGAGFVGSNLVRRLLEQRATVTVLDDLFTGRRENLPA